MLLEDYYTVTDKQSAGEQAYVYGVELNPRARVYEGHFPGMPVSPGVYSIGIINRCASDACGLDLLVRTVDRCRFLKVISPQESAPLTVSFTLAPLGQQSGSYAVTAKITSGTETFVDFRGEMGAV